MILYSFVMYKSIESSLLIARYKNNTTRSKHVNSCINKYWFQLTPTVCVFLYSTQVEELRWFPNCGLAKIVPHIENSTTDPLKWLPDVPACWKEKTLEVADIPVEDGNCIPFLCRLSRNQLTIQVSNWTTALIDYICVNLPTCDWLMQLGESRYPV